jgi:hypothetical protein
MPIQMVVESIYGINRISINDERDTDQRISTRTVVVAVRRQICEAHNIVVRMGRVSDEFLDKESGATQSKTQHHARELRRT